MTTLCNFWRFSRLGPASVPRRPGRGLIPLVSVVLLAYGVLVLGCEKKTAPPDPKPPDLVDLDAEPVLEDADAAETRKLEERCFEGDPEACDELGH